MVDKTHEGLMTIEEFVRLYDEEGPFEIINGERIILSPTKAGHVSVTKRVFMAVERHAEDNDLGEAFFEGPFVELDIPSWVKGSLVPDVMFYSKARIERYKSETPDWQDKPFVLVPDLVVEVISSNDKFTKVAAKVDLYLKDGVRMVWLADQERRSITAHTPGEYKTLNPDDTLTGGDVLPGFSVKVDSLFA
jgi:Uma2 family endonuclease